MLAVTADPDEFGERLAVTADLDGKGSAAEDEPHDDVPPLLVASLDSDSDEARSEDKLEYWTGSDNWAGVSANALGGLELLELFEVWRFWQFWRFGRFGGLEVLDVWISLRFGGFLLHPRTWGPEASVDLARLEVLGVWRCWRFGGFAACCVYLHARRPEASGDLACFEVLELWRVCCKAGTSTYLESRGLGVRSLFERLWRFGARLPKIYRTSIEHRTPITHIGNQSNIYRKSVAHLSKIY